MIPDSLTKPRVASAAIAMTLAWLAAPSPLSAQPEEQSIGPQLPPRVRALLTEEMLAILRSSQTILEALVRGQHEIVAEQARRIHESFILKQRMTPEDRAALLDAATPAFLRKDEAFHALADRLADAAQRRDHAEQRRLFGEMLDACAACHREHAADRFPALSTEHSGAD